MKLWRKQLFHLYDQQCTNHMAWMDLHLERVSFTWISVERKCRSIKFLFKQSIRSYKYTLIQVERDMEVI